MSTQYIPLPNGCANTNMQHSNRHLKPKICLPRRHRPPLEGESVGGTANGYTHSSSGQSMPQQFTTSPNEARSGNGDKPIDTLNELEMLIIVSIELEVPDSGEIPQVCLGSMSWRTDDPNGLGNQTDVSHGEVEVSRGSVGVPGMSNHTEMAMLGHRDSRGTYLRPGDAKHSIRETDGVGSHVDMLTWSMDIPSVETHALIPTKVPKIISTCPTEPKCPNPPTRGKSGHANEMDRSRNHLGVLNMPLAMHSVENDSEMPVHQEKPTVPFITIDHYRLLYITICDLCCNKCNNSIMASIALPPYL